MIDDGGSRTPSRGLCIALCGPDHRVIGGSVGGVLTAAGTVQVIAYAFSNILLKYQHVINLDNYHLCCLWIMCGLPIVLG